MDATAAAFAFFEAHGVLDAVQQAMRSPPPRAFWVRPHAQVDDVVATMERETGVAPLPASFPPRFFTLPADVLINATTPYADGRIVSLDVSSGLAVAALDVHEGDDCLDLCAAPGVKLLMVADLAGGDGSVTGVDISTQRLATCRALAVKYRVPRVRLYRTDGQTFSVEAPPQCSRGPKEPAHRAVAAQLKTLLPALQGPMPFHCSSIFRNRWTFTGRLYDRVLVDAECTHDGSVRHLIKAQEDGWQDFVSKSLNPQRLTDLPRLQLALLQRGFALLRPGGVLVYSTCSLTREQNEDVVGAFLAAEGSAVVLPATPTGIASIPAACRVPIDAPTALEPPDVSAAHFLRLDPRRSGTSGLFIAKLTRN